MRTQPELVPTVFIIIFHSNDKIVWIMMSSMLSIFSFQALEKLDLEIMDFWLFIELSILEWFPTWFFKYCMDEKSDHKVGIYCNLIGPLDQS